MKIINIILTSQNGGAEQVFIDYSAVLQKVGHEVLAIVKNDAPYADKLSELGINFQKIENKFGYHDFFAVKKIQKIIEEFAADVVIAHMGRSVILVRKAVKKSKKKIFQIAVNHSTNVKRSIGADYIFSVNREIFYRTVDLGQPENRTFVIHNAIDLPENLEQKPEINLAEKDVISVGLMGRFEKGKGFEYAIKALKILQKKTPKKIILKIAGSGDYQQNLLVLIKDLQIADQIEFIGWVKDKEAFFDSIDIFCLPSKQETFGLVILEAMKYQKPIIASNADGPKEILRNEVDGLVIDILTSESPENQIADAVLKIINDSDLANKMIRNSLVRLKERFSYKALECAMRELLPISKKLKKP